MLDAAHYLFWKVALKRGAVAELTLSIVAPGVKGAVLCYGGNMPESGKVTSIIENDNTYYGIIENDNTYYVYDKTDLAGSMTNMNRIDYYIKFANSERLRGYKFNAYAYLIVDGKVIISKDVSTLCIDDCGTRVYE